MDDLQESQLNAIKQFKQDIENKEINFIQNDCVCCNNTKKDLLITDTDRYGFYFPNKLCKSCGIIYASEYLDNESIMKFYTKYYRKIYDNNTLETYFQFQANRGIGFMELLKQYTNFNNINKIVEVGCGRVEFYTHLKNMEKK